MTGAMIQKISLQGRRLKPRGVIVSRTVRMLWFPDSVFVLLLFVSSKSSLQANEHFEMDSHHSGLRQILFLKNTQQGGKRNLMQKSCTILSELMSTAYITSQEKENWIALAVSLFKQIKFCVLALGKHHIPAPLRFIFEPVTETL